MLATDTALFIYSLLIITIGITGNMVLLYCSIAYKEIANTCKITLRLIKHLTICDLLCLVLLGAPAVSFYLCELCLFRSQDAMCYYTSYLRPALTSANFKFVFLISIHRLARCAKPRATLTIQPVFIEISAAVVYVISAGEASLTYITMDKIDFQMKDHGCFADVTNATTNTLIVRFLHVGFAMLVPFVGTILANVLLWIIACKTTHKFDLKPLLTVTVISGLILISWLPFIIYMVQKYVLKTNFDYTKMEEIAFNLVLLSMCCNPIVYTVFNKSLLQFLQNKVRQSVCKTSQTGPSSSSNNSNVQTNPSAR